jgi:hypothetical protein
MFKDIGYERAILEKIAWPGALYRDKPAPPHQPEGARSQSVPYFLGGVKIALCHHYLLPDGGLGASGLPDPKLIQYQGHILYCHSNRCGCRTCSSPPENWRAVIQELSRSQKD